MKLEEYKLGKSDVSTHLFNVERVWGQKEKNMHRSIVTGKSNKSVQGKYRKMQQSKSRLISRSKRSIEDTAVGIELYKSVQWKRLGRAIHIERAVASMSSILP